MKLLVVDDHAVIRQGLVALLGRWSLGAEVLQAEGVDTALALADAHPDLELVLLDLALPGRGGMAALREMGLRRPALPVVVLSASEDPGAIRAAIGAGALGYVPKSASAATLLAALQLVMSGEVYVPPILLHAPADEPVPPGRGSPPGLTPRQAQVLDGMASGRSNGAIGRALGMSEKTVKTHVTAILRTLGAQSRAGAVARAAETGLLAAGASSAPPPSGA